MARRGENIHKRKDGRWEGRYIKARTPEGKIQWGYVYGADYADVKRVLIQKKAEAGFYNLKRTDLTFEVLAEVWLHSLRNSIKESTYAHYSYTLHKYLLPVLSKVPVASLDESFLEQAMQQIISPADATHKPLGNSSARECLSMLRRICKYAAHLRLIRPMELEIALPKAIDKISVPLSLAEQQRLYQYVQEIRQIVRLIFSVPSFRSKSPHCKPQISSIRRPNSNPNNKPILRGVGFSCTY